MGAPVDRRGFFGRMAAALGALFAGLFAAPGVASLLDPALRGTHGRWVDAGPLASLREGEARKVAYPVRAGWETRQGLAYVVRRGDEVLAFDPTCTHAGCQVRFRAAAGAEAGTFLCPCHGGVFSLAGEPLKRPVTEPLRRLPARVEDGQVKVEVRG